MSRTTKKSPSTVVITSVTGGTFAGRIKNGGDYYMDNMKNVEAHVADLVRGTFNDAVTA